MHDAIPYSGYPPPPTPIVFSGERRTFRNLVLRGALLELITFGFYRFWLATDMRRHMWAHTAVDGDPVEYTGRARELLIGFLFAVAILMPVYLIYFLIGIEAELLQAFASFPLVVFMYLFSQFALYRARRYRVTRTVWRGLRFAMGGSGWGYAWRAGLWTLATGLSFGIALPWREAALERYKMRHTAYGNLQGRFEGTGGDLFRRAWFLWLATPFALLFVVPLPFLYAAYKSIQWRWWIAGMRFGDANYGEVSFRCFLDWSVLLGIYWKVIGWFVLISLAMSLWVGAVFGSLYAALATSGTPPKEAFEEVSQHGAALAGIAVGYLLMAVLFGAISRLYMYRDIWARVAASTIVFNLALTEGVTGQGVASDAIGEGLADNLDLGGF